MADAPSKRDGSHTALDAAGERTTSVGLYLAGQRRLRGVSVDELAERTRIPRRNIERLEAGAFDRAPDGYSRSFVRTIAAALGLDPDEAVMRLMTEPVADDLGGSGGLQRIAVVVSLLAVGALGLVLLWKLGVSLLAAGATAPAAEIVYRYDAVRALAAQRPLDETAAAALPGAGETARAPSQPRVRPSAAELARAAARGTAPANATEDSDERGSRQARVTRLPRSRVPTPPLPTAPAPLPAAPTAPGAGVAENPDGPATAP